MISLPIRQKSKNAFCGVSFFCLFFSQVTLARSFLSTGRSWADCQKGISAFSQTLHPILRRDCRHCHDKGSLGPNHSVEETKVSYSYMLTYVNWQQIYKSKLIKKVAEKHWLNYPGEEEVTATEEEVKTALEKWWEDGQSSCPLFGNTQSRPVALSQGLKEWTQVRALIPAFENQELYFSLEVRSDGKRYFLRKPILQNLKQSFKVSEVHTLLNGRVYQTAFNLINSAVSPEPNKTSAVLSAHQVVLPIELLNQDVLSFGFEKLELAPEATCKDLERFRWEVMSVVELRRCQNCHANEPVAKSRLDMSESEDKMCQAFLARAGGKYAVESPLIAYPLKGVNGHQIVIPHEAEILPSWVDWIRSEKPQGTVR